MKKTINKRYQYLSMHERVQLATPTARAMLQEGIDTYTRTEDDTIERVLALIGDREVHQILGTLREEERGHIDTAILAGLALGIAVGLLTRPESFAGGVR